MAHPATVLVANPSADVYGADLQMLQSVAALRRRGWRVVVATPSEGPLRTRLHDLGAETRLVDFPVLKRSNASAGGLAATAGSALRSIPRLRRVIREVAPSVVYVNTVTLPWWLLAARAARTPAVCHVHEAEVNDSRLVRTALTAPLRLATSLIVVSRSALDAVCDVVPRLRGRSRLVYNCVAPPPQAFASRGRRGPWRMVVVGRLSPRKAPHVALEAAALLRRRGRDVEIELCGSGLESHAEYVGLLRRRAAEDDLAGAVRFAGYTSPVWPALAGADVLVAPSLGESFGLAVVEAQLAERPVVATAVQGHLETVSHETTGLLVPLSDPEAIADSVERLMDDPALACRLAARASQVAAERFSVERYSAELVNVLSGVSAARPRSA